MIRIAHDLEIAINMLATRPCDSWIPAIVCKLRGLAARAKINERQMLVRVGNQAFNCPLPPWQSTPAQSVAPRRKNAPKFWLPEMEASDVAIEALNSAAVTCRHALGDIDNSTNDALRRAAESADETIKDIRWSVKEDMETDPDYLAEKKAERDWMSVTHRAV